MHVYLHGQYEYMLWVTSEDVFWLHSPLLQLDIQLSMNEKK